MTVPLRGRLLLIINSNTINHSNDFQSFNYKSKESELILIIMVVVLFFFL